MLRNGANNGFSLSLPRVMFDSTRCIYSISILIFLAIPFLTFYIELACCVVCGTGNPVFHNMPVDSQLDPSWFLLYPGCFFAPIGIYPIPSPPQMLAKISFLVLFLIISSDLCSLGSDGSSLFLAYWSTGFLRHRRSRFAFASLRTDLVLYLWMVLYL